MRLSHDEGVERDGHDAPGLRALGIKDVELIPDHSLEFVRRALGSHDGGCVIELVGVWNRDDLLAADASSYTAGHR